MKKLLLITALIFGIAGGAMAQTLTGDGYYRIQKSDAHIIQMTEWRWIPSWMDRSNTTDFMIKSVRRLGLINADWAQYKLTADGSFIASVSADKLDINDHSIGFYKVGTEPREDGSSIIKTGDGTYIVDASKPHAVGCSFFYKNADQRLFELRAELENEFSNTNYMKIVSNQLFYKRTTWIRK